MIMDALYLFDSALVLTTTQVSTNIIDLTNPRDMGIGDKPAIKLVMSVGTTFQSAGATTLTVAIEGSTDAVSWTTMSVTPAIAKANMASGSRPYVVDLPAVIPGQALPRYLRLNYTVGTGPYTAGNLTAALVLDAHQYWMYPAGQVVVN